MTKYIQQEQQNTLEMKRLLSECVKCGLCLNSCPTYQITQQELYSPRGRISIIEGLVANELSPEEPKVHQALLSCINCAQCVTACPTHIPFPQLLQSARANWHIDAPSTGFKKLLCTLLTFQQKHLRYLAFCYALFTRIRFVALFKHALRYIASNTYTRYARYFRLPKPRYTAVQDIKPSTHTAATVGIFIGCINSLCDLQSISDLQRILLALGIGSTILTQARCCGALAQTLGDRKSAAYCHVQNKALFNTFSLAHILTINPACHQHLQQTHANVAPSISTAWQYLTEQYKLQPLSLRGNNEHIVLHLPCTDMPFMQKAHPIYKLLSQIPNLSIEILPYKGHCCGGGHQLVDPMLAEDMAYKQYASYLHKKHTHLLTTNIGCAFQFTLALKKTFPDLIIEHPLSFLASKLL